MTAAKILARFYAAGYVSPRGRRVPKKPEKITLNHDFAFTSDAHLDEQIAAFRAAHEAEHQQILAMDARRSLGPGKVRVTFRVIEKKPRRG